MLKPRISTALLSLALMLASVTVAAAQTLRASAVSVEITPLEGVPLAGYAARRLSLRDTFRNHRFATHFEPSIGTLDPIRARILYLQKDRQRLVFVAVDLVGADRRMRTALIKALRPLGVGENEVFLSASHTHSGPGAFGRNWVWEHAAADHYVDSVYRSIVTKIVEGVRTAAAALEPATLFGYAFEADDLQMNRRDRPGMFDRTANILLAGRPDGSWIGGLANIAIHGTALPADNRLYSADVPGAMVAALERELQGAGTIRPVVLFINGAEGDVAPKEDGVSGMAAVAARFASQAMDALPSRTEISAEWSVLHGQVRLGRARFNLRACVPGSAVLRTLAAIPNLFIGTAFPRRTDIWAVNLGGHLMLTWPGEPITSVGMELKQLGASTGARQTWILGLTNDHLSYFVDPAEYRDEQRHSYEACSSLYGSAGGTKVISAFRTLLGFR